MPRLPVVLLAAAGLAAVAVAGLSAAGLRLTPLVLRDFDPQAAIARADRYDAEITRDEWGVPRVIGETDADAAFAFAYAHAEDDFFHIQQSLRAALGPDMLAAGEAELRSAFLVQALGVTALVDAEYGTQLSERARAFLEAYADGLNYYAALHPQEAEPDLFPVTGRDVAALSGFFSPLFYGMGGVLEELFAPVASEADRETQSAGLLYDAARGVELGSNAFAIAPSRSADGATRVIVNSHQPVEGPLAWYEAHLVSREGLDFAGGAFPGGPTLHLGANPGLAFAATVNRPDLIDVYELTLTPDGESYVLDGGVRAFETGEARILAHLWGPFAWRAVRPLERSVHGPVLRTPRGAFAVRYATLEELGWAEQSYRMMKARTLEAFDAAMQPLAMAATNRIAGDVNGRIARYYNARMPDRPEIDGVDWAGVLPGDRSDLVWEGFEPLSAMPNMIDPEAGYVLDANHSPFNVTRGPDDPDPADYPARYGIETAMTNRGLRAVELFAEDADGLTSRAELLAAKFDKAYHPESRAMTLRAELIALDEAGAFAGDPALAAAMAIIRAWEGSTEMDDPHAGLSLMTYVPVAASDGALGVGDAFRETVPVMLETYGRLDPPWSEVSTLSRGEAEVGLGGGPDTLRAVNSQRDGNGGLEMVSGDGLTMLWEAYPDGRVELYAVHQFGASNRPESPHYADQTEMFAAEAFRRVPLGEAAVRAAAVLVYRPGEEDAG